MSQAVIKFFTAAFAPIPSPDLPEVAPTPVNDALSPTATTVAGALSPTSPIDARSVSVSPDSHETPKPLTFLEAAAKADALIVTYLLRQKADLEQTDADGNTALHLAASHANGQKTVALLLHRGAALKANKAGSFAYQLSVQKGFSEITELFSKTNAYEFQPKQLFLFSKSVATVEKRKSPINGRLMIFCRDTENRIVQIYQHTAPKGPLPRGAFKVCKPALLNGIHDAVRLVTRTRGCSEKEVNGIQKNISHLIAFQQRMGSQRGLASLDMILLNKSVKDGSDSIDLYQKKYNLGDLFDLRESHGKISESKLLQISRDLLWGVYAIHQNGMAHCDIKLENILVNQKPDGNWETALTDFDLCAMTDESSNASGTPKYFSPEMACHLLRNPSVRFTVEQRQRADMWALGVVLYTIHNDWVAPHVFLEEDPARGGLTNYLRTISRYYETGKDLFAAKEPERNTVKHLVWQMLNYRSTKRITAAQALEQFEKLYPEKVPTAVDKKTDSPKAAAAGPDHDAAGA